jgi:beta-ureidopropionase / N-carbamoyl-L-amino-acid hydrolase
MTLLINADRFKADFDALAQIGATGDGGVNRVALSAANLEARQWFLKRAAEAGLETNVDSAGNHSAIYKSAGPSARTLLLGSHTDSVVTGGRYDGALGLIAAFEAVQTVKDAGLQLPVHLEAIDFTDEEGTLVGVLGSMALAGILSQEQLAHPRGGREQLEQGMARAGLTDAGFLAASRNPATLAGYLELHIEQGPRLIQSAIKIGVVSSIVGIVSYRIRYIGKTNHAGTTPMEGRADASLGAATLILTAREMVLRDFKDCVVNVGQMAFKPGGFNIIPGLAEFSLEFRSPDTAQLADLEKGLISLAHVIGRQYGLQSEIEFVGRCDPAPMADAAQSAVCEAADSLALTHTTLHSGAGHDAQSLAMVTPSGMIFIPSRDGISHSPLEFSEWDDCVNGANVLLRAALKMAEG